MNMEAENPDHDSSREEKTLKSLDNMQRAHANPLLYDRIMKSIESAEAKIVSMPPFQRWSIAAGLALLILLNAYSLRQHGHPHKGNAYDPFAKEYFSYLENQF
jgi:hypothetical protein